jgi:hypothetical protein
MFKDRVRKTRVSPGSQILIGSFYSYVRRIMVWVYFLDDNVVTEIIGYMVKFLVVMERRVPITF